MQSVEEEAKDLISAVKMEQMLPKWREFANQLSVQKKFYNFPLHD